MNKYNLNSFKVSTTPYNTESFLGYINDIFAFFQNNNLENTVVICDNVRFHKSEAILNAFRSSNNQILFLPPYSPMFNPIENLFSKWKKLVKNHKPNNERELLEAIEGTLNEITMADCEGFYMNMLREINKFI